MHVAIQYQVFFKPFTRQPESKPHIKNTEQSYVTVVSVFYLLFVCSIPFAAGENILKIYYFRITLDIVYYITDNVSITLPWSSP